MVVIDDDPDIRSAIQELLDEEGFDTVGAGDGQAALILLDLMMTDSPRFVGSSVDTAYDGPTGLAMATRRPPGVAVLDIGLPDMNGYELARKTPGAPLRGRGV